ncbi:MAG: hypothetical protein JOZ82_02570 [Marmoricola sp.]|nr:hypothetical protein [Marmoricola sp.]
MGEALRAVEIVATAACAVGAVWLLRLIVQDRTPGRRFLDLMIGLEGLLVLHLVLGVVHLVRDGQDVSAWEYVAYLVGTALVVPVGVVWSSGEQSRGGTAVLVVAMLVVPFMFLRLATIWSGGA